MTSVSDTGDSKVDRATDGIPTAIAAAATTAKRIILMGNPFLLVVAPCSHPIEAAPDEPEADPEQHQRGQRWRLAQWDRGLTRWNLRLTI